MWITKYRYKVLRGEVAERARSYPTDLRGARGNDCAGSGVAGPHSSAGGSAAAVGAGETGAVFEGTIEPDAAGGISASTQALLGAAFVGAVDEKTIQAYIENQKWDEDAESFKITAPTEPSAANRRLSVAIQPTGFQPVVV